MCECFDLTAEQMATLAAQRDDEIRCEQARNMRHANWRRTAGVMVRVWWRYRPDMPTARLEHRLPDARGIVRWLGIRWHGVPAPLRWRWRTLELDRVVPPLTGDLAGCGCMVRPKAAWVAVLLAWAALVDSGRDWGAREPGRHTGDLWASGGLRIAAV